MLPDFFSVLEILVRLGLPIAAFILSIVSFLIVNNYWRQSNRPIVAAMIRTNVLGNVSITFDLVLLNMGSRPATNIRLEANQSELQACLVNASQIQDAPLWRDVLNCFSDRGTITLLPQMKEITNSFGFTGEAGGKGPFWKYGSSFSICIRYCDLEGNTYKSRQSLIIKTSTGFASGFWSNAV